MTVPRITVMGDDFEPPITKGGRRMPPHFQLAFDTPGRWIEFEVPTRDAVQLARVYVSTRRRRTGELWELRASVNRVTAYVRYMPKEVS